MTADSGIVAPLRREFLTGRMETGYSFGHICRSRDHTGARPLEKMQSPVFFVGTPRSGTSLISRMVGSHPDIAVPFESFFYASFVPWLRHYGDLHETRNRNRLLRDVLQSARLRQWVPRVDAEDARNRIDSNGRFDFAGVVAGIMESWCNGLGKRRWGEKTPHHIFFADKILEGFPHAQFIHIVRDGRDVAVSWNKALFGPKHAYASARRWSEVLKTGQKLKNTLGPAQYLELRYEDLLQDTETTIRRVCDYLGEQYSSDMLGFHRTKDKYPTDARNEANLTKPVMANNVEKWRRCLSPREIRIFEAVAGNELERYGYERACRNAYLSNLERAFCKYIEHPPRKVVPLIRNRQSQTEALVRSMMYMRLRCGF